MEYDVVTFVTEDGSKRRFLFPVGRKCRCPVYPVEDLKCVDGSGAYGYVLSCGQLAIKVTALLSSAELEASLRELSVMSHFNTLAGLGYTTHFPLRLLDCWLAPYWPVEEPSTREGDQPTLPPSQQQTPHTVDVVRLPARRASSAAAASRSRAGVSDMEAPAQVLYVVTALATDTLSSILTRAPHPLPPAVRAACLLDIARSLAALHSAGIAHRDIKPSNVVVDSGGVWRLIDFGASRGGFADPREGERGGGTCRRDDVAAGTPPRGVAEGGAGCYPSSRRPRPWDRAAGDGGGGGGGSGVGCRPRGGEGPLTHVHGGAVAASVSAVAASLLAPPPSKHRPACAAAACAELQAAGYTKAAAKVFKKVERAEKDGERGALWGAGAAAVEGLGGAGGGRGGCVVPYAPWRRYDLSTGDDCVTLYCRAPEVASGSADYNGKAVDVWGFGCVAASLLLAGCGLARPSPADPFPSWGGAGGGSTAGAASGAGGGGGSGRKSPALLFGACGGSEALTAAQHRVAAVVSSFANGVERGERVGVRGGSRVFDEVAGDPVAASAAAAQLAISSAEGWEVELLHRTLSISSSSRPTAGALVAYLEAVVRSMPRDTAALPAWVKPDGFGVDHGKEGATARRPHRSLARAVRGGGEGGMGGGPGGRSLLPLYDDGVQQSLGDRLQRASCAAVPLPPLPAPPPYEFGDRAVLFERLQRLTLSLHSAAASRFSSLEAAGKPVPPPPSAVRPPAPPPASAFSSSYGDVAGALPQPPTREQRAATHTPAHPPDYTIALLGPRLERLRSQHAHCPPGVGAPAAVGVAGGREEGIEGVAGLYSAARLCCSFTSLHPVRFGSG